MTFTAALLLAASCLYAGFQWTIRVLVYPQFAAVPGEAFARFERLHQRRVSVAVGPLFVLDGAASIAAFVVRPGIGAGLAGGCCALILVVTATAAVPQHRRLTDGFDVDAFRLLLRIDSVRLVLALVGVAAAASYAVTS